MAHPVHVLYMSAHSAMYIYYIEAVRINYEGNKIEYGDKFQAWCIGIHMEIFAGFLPSFACNSLLGPNFLHIRTAFALENFLDPSEGPRRYDQRLFLQAKKILVAKNIEEK